MDVTDLPGTSSASCAAPPSSNVKVSPGFVDLAEDAKLYYEIRSPVSLPSGAKTEKLVMIMGAFSTLKHYEEQAEFTVEHFAKSSTPFEVMTFDNRCIGKSTAPAHRQTTRLLADDTLALINKVWGESTQVHVFGASLGGMIGQELAVSLAKSGRLCSLYLVVTSRGNYIRPLAALSTGAFSAFMPFFIKSDPEKMIREVVIPSNWSKEAVKEQGEKYAKIWTENYDDWFAFNNKKACASQLAAVMSHHLTNEGVRTICDSKALVTVHIATKDKVIAPKKQRELAKLLKAKSVEFDQGHVVDDSAKPAVFQAVMDHFKSATGQKSE